MGTLPTGTSMAKEYVLAREFVPFVNITTALTPRAPRLGEHDIILEQTRPIRGAEGELIPRKLQVRVTAAVLQCSQRLRELLETAKPGQELLTAQIQADALSVEAVAKALQWTALPPDEQTQLFEHASVKSLINVMHAAAWLGSNTLKSICETKLCAVLCLENVRRKCRARACRPRPAARLRHRPPTPACDTRLARADCRPYNWHARRSAANRRSCSRAPSSSSRPFSAPTMMPRARAAPMD